ncbi:MAG TPA: hypothetical protein VFM93_08200 [Candidatus Limnocylindria bacterium]|nr:hypothetical protein [Candidatus Limnocylindria bacterium]
MTTTREAFERSEARCPSCRRPIGPQDQPTFVRGLGGAEARLATMRCGRCSAMLTIRFEDRDAMGAGADR